jgi:hypothetical protein
MRHRQDEEEKNTRDDRKSESLGSSEWCGREKGSQSPLEHSRTKECRLKTGTASARLRDLEEKIAVCIRITEGGDDAVVAIHFHSETQAAELPPEREIPRGEYQPDRCDEEKEGGV